MPSPLITPLTLALPDLPPALEGLRILHVTDLHVRRFKDKYRAMIDAAGAVEHDLMLLTGDYMHRVGCESAAREVMGALLEAARPRLGAFGVLGNHDHAEFFAHLRDLPATWLRDEAVDVPGAPIRVAGLWCHFDDREGDPRALLQAERAGAQQRHPSEADPVLRIFLSHMPIHLRAAAAGGMDLMFSGHTHGGQCRLPGRVILYNACAWPRRLSAGHMQLGRTHLILSRGLGESNLDDLRWLCPRQMPLVTLTRAEPDQTPIEPKNLVGHTLW